MRCGVDDVAALEKLLGLFFAYERAEIAEFRKAVEQFKTDLPAVLEGAARDDRAAERDNDKFRKAALRFLKHAQDTINPSVTAADVREMLIQHILTEEIFSQVFDNSDFHRQNNVAKELYALEDTFFTGKVKHDTLAGLRSYYAAIKSTPRWSRAITRSRPSSRSSTRISTRSTTRRRPTASAWSIRRTRSCAS